MKKSIQIITAFTLLLATQFLPFYLHAKNTKSNKSKSTQVLSANKTQEQQKIFGWLVDKVVTTVTNWFAPDGGYGQYNETAHYPVGPYFMFRNDHYPDVINGTLYQQLLNVRQRILYDTINNFVKIYKDIYDIAGNPTLQIPSQCVGKEISVNANRAKACAFVFLIGIAYNTDSSTYSYLDLTTRASYRTLVYDFLGKTYNDSLDIYYNYIEKMNYWLPFGETIGHLLGIDGAFALLLWEQVVVMQIWIAILQY